MNIAAIFAGGVGRRMNSKERPKQFLLMHNIPIIIHTINLFENHPDIDCIVVACIEDWIPYLKNLLKQYNIKKVKKIVPGGTTGQESIFNTLTAAKDIVKDEKSIVLIHDGVRPLITSKTITNNIESVKLNGSAITCVDAKETVITSNDDNTIESITDRNKTKLARAPQSFWLDEILEIYTKAFTEKREFIDSCSMMNFYGKKLFLIEGPSENIKITTPDDFYIMRAILDAKENEQIYGFE